MSSLILGSLRESSKTDHPVIDRFRFPGLGILAARLGRAVYHLLRKGESFDEERFWNGGGSRARTGSSSLSAPEVAHAGD